jgi:hypothetical protein
MFGDPVVDLLRVGVRVARIALAPCQDLACGESYRCDVGIEIVATDSLELLERTLDEREIGDAFEIVGPVIRRVVVERKVTPGTHLSNLHQRSDLVR